MANSESSYIYYEGENGAVFRQPAGCPVRLVEEIKTTDGWKLYEGDRARASRFLTQISEDEACHL